MSARGALKDLVTFTSRSLGNVTSALSVVIAILLSSSIVVNRSLCLRSWSGFRSRSWPPGATRRTLHLFQQMVQALIVRLPDVPILLDPGVGFGEGLPLEPAWTTLRVLANADQARPLEDLQVFGDGRLAHVERLGQLGHRRLTPRQARQDGPSRWIGERQKRRVEAC